MALGSYEIAVVFKRRRAEINVNKFVAKRYDIPEGLTPCFVHGAMPEQDCDMVVPVFVCELFDGRVINVYTEQVRFTDTDERGEVICD